MKVALTVNDFLRRAEEVYPHRIAVIDEPDQLAASLGSFTYGEMAAKARAIAAHLDALGIAQGERVAMVSQNSARLLNAFDKRYSPYAGYSTFQSDYYYYPADGRTFLMTASYNFR